MEILLVEDNPADVRLTQEAFRESKLPAHLNFVMDGMEAVKYLRRENGYARAVTPDLILLDWNLPRMDGQEVLAEIKNDANLCKIPVVVLTTSSAVNDVKRAYELRANCFITKPVDLEEFFRMITEVERFWLCVAKLPAKY